MPDREKVISKLDELRQFADMEIHPIVSPDNWDVYSKLCDLIDLTKDNVLVLLKEQEACVSKGQESVVRCKDCIHNGKVEKCVLAAIAAEKGLPLFMLDNHGEWFCGDGKPKKGVNE